MTAGSAAPCNARPLSSLGDGVKAIEVAGMW
jgi:hypothetical protein